MYKEYQIVMLSTDKANSNLFIHQGLGSKEKVLSSGQGIVHRKEMMACGVSQPQYLYILSDDDIKEGDWFVNLLNNSLGNSISLVESTSKNCKKIIATTDNTLVFTKQNRHLVQAIIHVPQIPTSFIEHYIQQYNNGNVIDKVLIEYYVTHETEGDKPLCIKVNSNNEITIKPNKTSWNRDEVVDKLLSYKVDLLVEIGICKAKNEPLQKSFTDEWISKNL